MPDYFFDLSEDDQKDLLEVGFSQLGMQPFVLEKDVWICWVLQQLFSMPNKKEMAFKGGTSLSKVYKAIDRFSEDIDVTIDYRGSSSPITGNESRSQLQKLSEQLRRGVFEYTTEVIVPHLKGSLQRKFGEDYGSIEVDAQGEAVRVCYQSVLDVSTYGYVSPSVLLEFGGRNITEPNEVHVVKPYLISVASDVTYPEASVTVLAKERTFWEKATLIHVECNRTTARSSADRISRHWYDLFRMSEKLDNYKSAKMYELLTSVVQHKNAFYYSGTARYTDCLIGKLRLVPGEPLTMFLRADFTAMQSAGMFYDEPPAFDEILDLLAETERQLNEAIKRFSP